MTTIFLTVLKKLIKEKLSALSSTLLSQTKSFGYNKQLSLDQKEIIDSLEEAIIRFDATGNDDTDSKAIAKLLETYRAKIQVARESHSAARDEGNTISCISNLLFHTTGFHSKLDSFKFSLLNKEHNDSPDGIVYYHAAYYFGEEVFTPLPNSDTAIRAEKEKRLQIRLQSLSELIKPQHTLEERKERALQVLADLASDNQKVVRQDDLTNMPIPGLSFWGVQMTTDVFAPSLGRFGEQFNLAIRKIKAKTAMTAPRSADQSAEPSPVSRRAPEQAPIRLFDRAPDAAVPEATDSVSDINNQVSNEMIRAPADMT